MKLTIRFKVVVKVVITIVSLVLLEIIGVGRVY